MWAMFVKNTGILAHSIYTVERQRSTGITSKAIETEIILLIHLLVYWKLHFLVPLVELKQKVFKGL